MRQGPLAGRYPVVAAMVVSALVPYLVLSAALQPLAPIIAGQLHMSPQAMNLSLGMANAAYAVGNVAALLFFGRVSDRAGRRLIALSGIATLIVAALVFLLADGIASLYIARASAGPFR